MLLTNNQIYNYANALVSAFQDKEQRLPMKLNFFIQKNKKILLELAQDIEQARVTIAQTHGKLDEATQQFIIPPEEVANAQQELIDLFSIEQEVNIGMVKADSLNDDFNLTTAQMEAIMFMIEEA